MARLLWLIVVVLALLVPGGAIAQKPRAERPTYTVGERWILTDGEYRLVSIDRGIYVFSAGPDREFRLSRDLGIQRVKRGGDVIEFDPPAKLGWPLEVGKWGSSVPVVKLHGEIEISETISLTWKVMSYEDVTVPAGTFKAFHIVYALDPERPGQSIPAGSMRDALRQLKWDFSLWYAPAVSKLVQGESRRKAFLTFGMVSDPSLAPTAAPPAGSAPATAAPPSVVAPPGAAPPPAAPAPPTAPAPPAPAAPPSPAPAKPGAAAPPAAGSLKVVISSPQDRARTEQAEIPLTGLVSSAKGVTSVVVTLNGAEVSRVDDRRPRSGVSLASSLKLHDGTNTLVVAVTEADGTVSQEVRTIEYDRPVPLTLSFRFPADGARLTEDSTVVAAGVTSARGVAAVALALNGTEVFRRGEGGQRSVVVTAPVTLREGANTLVLSATDADGTIRQEVRTVYLDRARPAAAAPAAPSESWAVVIGVGRYDNPNIPSLRYAVPDAEAIYGVLTRPGGIPKDHVILLTDRAERKPTLRNIKWALGTFLARSARKDDTVLVFFAGHGAPEVDPRGIERDGLAKYLIPSDADPDDLFSTALPMDDMQTIFARIEAERVVALLDACYSGAAGGRTFASKKTRATAVDDLFLERLTRSKGRAIVTASRPAEVSIELPELGHGIFTYYVVEGLKGAADLNRDGIVSLQELYEYVEQQVVRKSRSVGGNQHPVMKGELEGVLPLAKVSGR